MVRQFLPLNGLRAFEASARHLSFTRAAIELCVTQAAVSQQVKGLENDWGFPFQRLPRGLKITAEGEALLPTVTSSFDQMAITLDRIEAGQVRELLFLGVVGTFAVGWLLPRLREFQKRHPFIDVRVSTNNNRVDMAAEGWISPFDLAGLTAWHGCIPAFRGAPFASLYAETGGDTEIPADLADATLLRSYRSDEWATWFAAAGVTPVAQVNAGIVFDTSLGMMEAALQGLGVALARHRCSPASGIRGYRPALPRHHIARQLLADEAAIKAADTSHAGLLGLDVYQYRSCARRPMTGRAERHQSRR